MIQIIYLYNITIINTNKLFLKSVDFTNFCDWCMIELHIIPILIILNHRGRTEQ